MLFSSSSSRFVLTRSSGEILNGKPERASIDSKQLCVILMGKTVAAKPPTVFISATIELHHMTITCNACSLRVVKYLLSIIALLWYCSVSSYGSPIFKVVQQKRCTALYTAL